MIAIRLFLKNVTIWYSCNVAKAILPFFKYILISNARSRRVMITKFALQTIIKIYEINKVYVFEAEITLIY